MCYATGNVISWLMGTGASYNISVTMLMMLTAWLFFVGLMTLACLFLCIVGVLSWRYNLFLHRILREVLATFDKNVHHIHENVRILHKAPVGIEIFFTTFLIGTFASGVPYQDLFKMDIPGKQMFLLVGVAAVVPAYLITRRKLVGLCKAIKMSPVAYNCILTSSILLFLYGTTYITRSTMKDASNKVQRLRIEAEETMGADLTEETTYGSPKSKDEVAAWIWFSLIFLYTSLFGLWAAFFCLFFSFSLLLRSFLAGHPIGHHTSLKHVFNTFDETKTKTPSASLRLPLMAVLAVWIMFFALSTGIWGIVLSNLSTIDALIMPTFQLIPLSNGEATVKAANTFASLLLGNAATNWSVYFLSLFMLLPALVPSLLLVYLNFRALRHSLKKNYVPLSDDNDVAKQTSMIASRMGVSKVYCVLDEQSNAISPYAQITGWLPKRNVVFTYRGLRFLEEHAAHAEAILAHEIAHLKNDCPTMWKLGILSRIGIVGAGFLSVLHDSITMEDRADDASRHYLRERGMDEALLTEAVFMLEAETYLEEETHNPQQSIILPKNWAHD